MADPRYEVQVFTKAYGWCSAGNWPARTLDEGMQSLAQCAKPFGGSKTYRLVELVEREVARKRSRKRGE